MGQRVGAPRRTEGWEEEHLEVGTPGVVVNEYRDSQGSETLNAV